MGLDRKVRFDPKQLPAWPAMAAKFKSEGLAVSMRMINGELAFPDEEPEPDWRELRVAAAGNMITLRRDPDGISLVIWGNADDALKLAWEQMAHAIASLTHGSVE
ncbi:MAG: hypothetical protein K2X38_15030 [Gemmataceae bacterium]|nr:hypothetical protein [Gemmataceae bacterium]